MAKTPDTQPQHEPINLMEVSDNLVGLIRDALDQMPERRGVPYRRAHAAFIGDIGQGLQAIALTRIALAMENGDHVDGQSAYRRGSPQAPVESTSERMARMERQIEERRTGQSS